GYVGQRLDDRGPHLAAGENLSEMPEDFARRDHGEAVDEAEAAQAFEQQHQRERQREPDPARRHGAPAIARCDSSRSNSHSRAVISPKRGVATTLLPRSSPQPVPMISSMRPGRADITPMRSPSIAASSSECVISMTVAPDSRQS